MAMSSQLYEAPAAALVAKYRLSLPQVLLRRHKEWSTAMALLSCSSERFANVPIVPLK